MNPKKLQRALKESQHLESDDGPKAKKAKKSFKERIKSLFVIKSNREKKTKNLRVRNHAANAEPIQTPEVIKASPKRKFQRFLDLFKRKRKVALAPFLNGECIEAPEKVSPTTSQSVDASTKVGATQVAQRLLPAPVEGCNTQGIVTRKAGDSSVEVPVEEPPASTDDGQIELIDDIPIRPGTSMAFNIVEDPSRAHLKPMLRPKTPNKPKLSRNQEIFKIQADQLRAEEKRMQLIEKKKENLPSKNERVSKNQELLKKLEAERKKALNEDVIRKKKNKQALENQKISKLKAKSSKVALASERVKVEKAARVDKKKVKMERKLKTAQERKHEMLSDKLEKLKSRHSQVKKLCKDKKVTREADILAEVRDFNSFYGVDAEDDVITDADRKMFDPEEPEKPLKSVSEFIENPDDRPITPALSRFPYHAEDDRPITPADPSIYQEAVDGKRRRESRKTRPKTALVIGKRTPHHGNAEPTAVEKKTSKVKAQAENEVGTKVKASETKTKRVIISSTGKVRSDSDFEEYENVLEEIDRRKNEPVNYNRIAEIMAEDNIMTPEELHRYKTGTMNYMLPKGGVPENEDEFEEVMENLGTNSVHSEKSTKAILIPKGGLSIRMPKKHVTFEAGETEEPAEVEQPKSYEEVIARVERKENNETMKEENKHKMVLPKVKKPGQFDYREFLMGKMESYNNENGKC